MYQARYAYDGGEHAESTLPLQEGDGVILLEKFDEQWARVLAMDASGKAGLVPLEYLQVCACRGRPFARKLSPCVVAVDLQMLCGIDYWITGQLAGIISYSNAFARQAPMCNDLDVVPNYTFEFSKICISCIQNFISCRLE